MRFVKFAAMPNCRDNCDRGDGVGDGQCAGENSCGEVRWIRAEAAQSEGFFGYYTEVGSGLIGGCPCASDGFVLLTPSPSVPPPRGGGRKNLYGSAHRTWQTEEVLRRQCDKLPFQIVESVKMIRRLCERHVDDRSKTRRRTGHGNYPRRR